MHVAVQNIWSQNAWCCFGGYTGDCFFQPHVPISFYVLMVKLINTSLLPINLFPSWRGSLSGSAAPTSHSHSTRMRARAEYSKCFALRRVVVNASWWGGRCSASTCLRAVSKHASSRTDAVLLLGCRIQAPWNQIPELKLCGIFWNKEK